MDDPDQLKNYLTRARVLLDSPTFRRDSPEEGPWRPAFTELIQLVQALLDQAQQRGKRIDFLEDVGVNGKIQDITSLVNWMYRHLPELTTDQPGQLQTNRLNRYFDQGTGYFANGCFFTTNFDSELAFYIDDQRIYLNRHIRRAIDEVVLSA